MARRLLRKYKNAIQDNEFEDVCLMSGDLVLSGYQCFEEDASYWNKNIEIY